MSHVAPSVASPNKGCSRVAEGIHDGRQQRQLRTHVKQLATLLEVSSTEVEASQQHCSQLVQ